MVVFTPGVYPALPPTKWILERNPGPESKYRIVDVGDSPPADPYIYVDKRWGDPLDDNSAYADVIRRAYKYRNNGPQAIEFGPGCTFNKADIYGAGSANADPTAWWAPSATSPIAAFEPIRDLHFFARDPVNGRPAFLSTHNLGARVENAFGASTDFNDTNGKELGPFSWRGFDFGNGGQNYCFRTQLGRKEVFRKLALYDCRLVGTAGSVGGWDCLMGIRAAYAPWELIDVVMVGAPKEHFAYTDAVQGDSIFANCFVGAGLAGKTGPGRTMFQFVQRASEGQNAGGQPFYGSNVHFGFGTVYVTDNVCIGAGESGAHAFTHVGHLGSTISIGNRALECKAGGLLFWSDWAKSIHTTAGPFLTDGVSPKIVDMPISGTAFNFGDVYVDDFVMTQASVWTSPRSPMRFAGCQLLELGTFDVDLPDGTGRPTIWFWEHNTSGVALDPLDNGVVRFLSSKVGSQVSTWPGWNPGGSRKAVYGDTDNNNQPSTGGKMTDAQLNALVDDNGEDYAPWFQAGPGTVAPNSVTPLPVVVDLRIPDVTVTQPTTISVTPDPVIVTLSAPDPVIAAPISVDPGPIRIFVEMPHPTIAAPISVEAQPVRVVVNMPTVSIDDGITVDVEPVSVELVVPDPVVAAPISVSPDPVIVTLSAPDVSLGASLAVTPDPVVVELVIPAPAIAAPFSVDPQPVRVVLSAPEVELDDQLAVYPDPVIVTLVATDPTVSAPIAISPDPVVVELEAPDVLGPTSLIPGPVVVTLTIPKIGAALQALLSSTVRHGRRILRGRSSGRTGGKIL